MAKPKISFESLEPLGLQKLAKLIVDEAEGNTAFRKTVNAALASLKGPKAIAAIIDRRLAALAKARSFVDWDKARNFAADLAATVRAITDELAPADRAMAAERLIAFIATSAQVFERVNDSSGRVQGIYEDAIVQLGTVAAAMPEKTRHALPGMVTDRLTGDEHGYLDDIAAIIAPLIPAAALKEWDQRLAAASPVVDRNANDRDWTALARARTILAARQSIASALGDLDSIIALEETKEPRQRDHEEIASLLLNAGRAEEALRWIRQRETRNVAYMSRAALADGADVIYPSFWLAVPLEARILDTLGRKDEAQTLRWNAFEKTLNPEFLREHLKHAEDFAEFEILDRAFAAAERSPQIYAALRFYLDWPQLDKAAAHVIQHRDKWDGRHYDILGEAAESLERSHPGAATILYRALLKDILVNAKSKAYGHAARYLKRLDELAPYLQSAGIRGLASHTTYRLELAKTHGRKSAFWSEAGRLPGSHI
jgi:hypothetical protein